MPYDAFLSSLNGAAGASSTTIAVRGYFKCNDTGSTLADSSTVASNGTIVGSPSLSQAGYVYGESNGGDAVLLNGTSQNLNLGARTSFLAQAVGGSGIWFSFLCKTTSVGSGANPKAYLCGFESGSVASPVRGVQITTYDPGPGPAFRVRVSDNAGTVGDWFFSRLFCQHFDEDVWHHVSVQIKLTAGTTASTNVTLRVDGSNYSCTSHTPVTIAAISELSSGRWAIGANSVAGTASYPTSQGSLSVQRIAIGTGVLTDRQAVDLYRECSYTFMGVANPIVAALFDSASAVGASGDGGAISAVTNYGDSDFTIAQGTSANQPQWTTRFGGAMDVGAGLDTSVQTDSKFLYINRASTTKKLYRGDMSSLAVVGSICNAYWFQSATIGNLYNTAGSTPTTLIWAYGAGDYTVSTNENPQLGCVREGGTTYSARSNSLPDKRPFTCLPSFSVVGILGGRNSSGYSAIGSASMYVDGEVQVTNADFNNGAYYTPPSGTGNIAAIYSPSTSGRFGGMMKAYVKVNRTISDVEADDFQAAARSRWPSHVANPNATKGLLIVGDSLSCGERGTLYKSTPWQSLMGISGGDVLCYNASVRNYYAVQTAGSLDMDTRINQQTWFLPFAGKKLTVIEWLGTNDFGEGNSAAQIATDCSTVLTNITTQATTAAVSQLKTIGVSLRLGTLDTFTALIATASYPTNRAVTIPAFTLADSLHPTEAGQQQIADVVGPVVRALSPELFGSPAKVAYATEVI